VFGWLRHGRKCMHRRSLKRTLAAVDNLIRPGAAKLTFPQGCAREKAVQARARCRITRRRLRPRRILKVDLGSACDACTSDHSAKQRLRRQHKLPTAMARKSRAARTDAWVDDGRTVGAAGRARALRGLVGVVGAVAGLARRGAHQLVLAHRLKRRPVRVVVLSRGTCERCAERGGQQPCQPP